MNITDEAKVEARVTITIEFSQDDMEAWKNNTNNFKDILASQLHLRLNRAWDNMHEVLDPNY